VKSRQTNDTSLTNEPSAVTENCHHACNKHRSGTKGIISSHQTFMHIPEHQTSHLHRQKETPSTTNRTKGGTRWTGKGPDEGVTASSRQINATALMNETSAETENCQSAYKTKNCHPTCKRENCNPAGNKPHPGTKGIILSHQTFMHISEHRTTNLHRQKETPSTTNRTKGGTSWTGERPEEGVTGSSSQTNASALKNETSAETENCLLYCKTVNCLPYCKTENCQPACNTYSPETKGIILYHQIFMDIPEH